MTCDVRSARDCDAAQQSLAAAFDLPSRARRGACIAGLRAGDRRRRRGRHDDGDRPAVEGRAGRRQAIEFKVDEAGTRWGNDIHLNVTSYNGNVLLTGEAPTLK